VSKELTINQIEEFREKKFAIIDIRRPDIFARGFIPGSYNVFLDNKFIKNALYFVQKDQAAIIVDEEVNGDENFQKIRSLGFKNLKGYLKGGIDIWEEFGKPLDLVISISAYEFSLELKHSKIKFIDIREYDDFKQKRIENTENLNVEDIIYEKVDINKNDIYCIFCNDGVSSMSVNSYMKTKVFHNIYHVSGGFQAAEKEKRIEFV
jgi:hydroxyacylglutathione hydrolase